MGTGPIHVYCSNDGLSHDVAEDCPCGPDTFYANDDHEVTIVRHHMLTKSFDPQIADIVWRALQGEDLDTLIPVKRINGV